MEFRLGTIGPKVCLFAWLVLSGCGGRGKEPRRTADVTPKAVPVTVEPATQRVVERTVEVVGTLKGWEDVTIGSKKDGRVLKVFKDIGDRVQPGEHLVQLEPEDARLLVRQAERRLQVELAKLGLDELPKGEFDIAKVPAAVQARVALEKARRNLERERSLIKRNAGTVQDFQNAESEARGAEAALANAILTAQSTLANARAASVTLEVAVHDLKELEIRAPVPSSPPRGVSEPIAYAVAKRSVAEGQMVRIGDPIMALVIQNPLRLWLNVPERSSAQVKIDQPVRVSVASFPDTLFDGKIVRINPSVDPASRTFQVEALVPNDRGQLRPGGFAKASILTDSRAKTTVVPIESIVKFAGVTKIFIVQDQAVHAVSVETGLEGPGWVEVIGDLPAKARVVVTGQSQLADGTPVTIRTDDRGKSGRQAANVDRVRKGNPPG
ncbi:MAG: efflux RND transporter periplasmic adaptor subunit [Isosphaeraceae bacterium]